MTAELPPYVGRELVAERLPLILPEGTPNRGYCIRELAASTVFTALYVGAIDGAGRHLGPVHVYRMGEAQAALSSDEARLTYARDIVGKGHNAVGPRWYADNTREPIRDETLRDGLVAIGAVVRREDLPTTSGLPRYALKPDFAAMFNPALAGEALDDAIAAFQAAHLSKGALARIAILRLGAGSSNEGVLVTFPNGETRQLAPGPSSVIARAAVEVFAPRFLAQPAVLWLSESGNKVVLRDDRIADAIGLKIAPDRNLPDIILADLGDSATLLVFVEVVATDGAIHEMRKATILALTDSAGFARNQVAFVTAYLDRQSAGYRKTVSQLAWGTFAWFVSEPERIVAMLEGDGAPTVLRGWPPS